MKFVQHKRKYVPADEAGQSNRWSCRRDLKAEYFPEGIAVHLESLLSKREDISILLGNHNAPETLIQLIFFKFKAG